MSRRALTSLAASAIVGVACIATVSTDAFAYRRGGAAVARGGVYHGGVNRVGVNRVGVDRAGIGYGRTGWNGYGRGWGVAAGVAASTAAAGAYYDDSSYSSNGYNDSSYSSNGYDDSSYSSNGYNGSSYSSAAYDDSSYAGGGYEASGGYTLNGAPMSESDAVAYCAQRFRSYDIASRTFVAYSGERVSCPQQ